jgi:hypothetical protein
LRRLGVRLVGRLAGVRDGTAQFSGLANVCALADLKLGRLLNSLDAWVDRAGILVVDPPIRLVVDVDEAIQDLAEASETPIIETTSRDPYVWIRDAIEV